MYFILRLCEFEIKIQEDFFFARPFILRSFYPSIHPYFFIPLPFRFRTVYLIIIVSKCPSIIAFIRRASASLPPFRSSWLVICPTNTHRIKRLIDYAAILWLSLRASSYPPSQPSSYSARFSSLLPTCACALPLLHPSLAIISSAT